MSLPESLAPAGDARPPLLRLRIGEEGRRGGEQATLSIGQRCVLLRALHRLPAALTRLQIGPRGPEGLEEGHRYPEMCGAALGMLRRDLLEVLTRLLVHHVMEQTYSAVEFRLYRRVAGNLEGDLADVTVFVPGFLGDGRTGEEGEREQRQG